MLTPFPIERVIAVTGLAGIARALGGLTPQAVNKWRRRRLGVPLDRCPAIEAIPGHGETCETLRPDVRWVRSPDGSITAYQVLAHVDAPKPKADVFGDPPQAQKQVA